jgi:kynurenine formamidase
MTLPSYDQLPPAPEGGRSAWGMFGDDDNVGLLNLLTPERIHAAAQLIRRGLVFPMDMPLGSITPPLFARRTAPRHHVVHLPGTYFFDDVYDNFYPQASSQWDSLGHVGYSVNAYYNAATEEDIACGRRNTIEHWARRGIAGRVVILDLVRTLRDDGRSYNPGTSTAFTVDDLEAARRRSSVDFRTGDIILLHTGFAAWYVNAPEAERSQVAAGMTTPGIAPGEDMCRYLWNTHASAVVSDTFAVEVQPPRSTVATEFLHRILIGLFGMALGEMWWTEDLAAQCDRDKVYEAFLVSAPMHAVGGVGSPANALVIK